MKKIIPVLFALILFSIGRLAFAGDTVEAVSCNLYDAATGTKLNESAGKMIDGQCKVEVNTDAISSSSTQLLIEITLNNGAKLKALEEEAAAKFLSGSKEVTSSVEASSSGQVAYYQGLAAGGAGCLSQAAATSLSSTCLDAMRFKSLSEMVSNLKGDSSASGQSVNSMASVMRGFLNSGGSDGMKDPVEYLKRLNDGDSSVLNRASDLARAGGGSTDAATLQKNFLLMHKVGQIAATALQEKSVHDKFGQDAVYKKKYFDFLKTFESADQAGKVSAAGPKTLKSFFKDEVAFKSTSSMAARELFIKEADSNFTDFADVGKASALFKTLASTNYSGRSLDEIQKGVSFISGYVHSSADSASILLKADVIAQFIANNFGVIDITKLDSQYFSSFQQQLQLRSSSDFLNNFSFKNFSNDGSPIIISHLPENGATDVRAASLITIALDRDIDPASVIANNFVVRCDDSLIGGTVSYNAGSRSVQFVPASLLPLGGSCSASVAGFRAASGKALSLAVWNWAVERAPFQIVSIFPQNDSRDVPSNSQIRIQFNYPVDQATVVDGTVVIKNCKVDGLFVVPTSGKEIDFTPDKKYKELTKGLGCQIEVSPNLRDVFGRALGNSSPAIFYLAKDDNNNKNENGNANQNGKQN